MELQFSGEKNILFKELCWDKCFSRLKIRKLHLTSHTLNKFQWSKNVKGDVKKLFRNKYNRL